MTGAVESSGRPTAQPSTEDAARALSHLPVLVQLLLATWVVFLYDIEAQTLGRVLLLASAAFAVQLFVPVGRRLALFAMVSMVGALIMLGPVDGLWLLGSGAALIGLCHLPLAIWMRAVLLIVVGLALGVARAGWWPVPWAAHVWPILGSMFMFRLWLYMLALKSGRAESGGWGALAYFFMLPNLAFPLYPVVDYQTFRRTHYDRPASEIYDQGVIWLVRGLIQLLLYRFVYQVVLGDPADVSTLGDLLQFMLGTFLLYLRVSGQFHLIVGVLHLFGFRLPETHKLYYLAHSFTDLWRRINIYWTDFMMKAVFYPTYFKVKRLGPKWTLVVSTGAVFLTTWILHSYQWFWLRGGFPMTAQDTLFWGILGALVVHGALKEASAPKKLTQRSGWSPTLALQSARTFGSFCLLWSLWSTDSVPAWLWMLGSAVNVDLKGIVLAAGSLGIVAALGGAAATGARAVSASPTLLQRLGAPGVRAAAGLVLLVILGQPAVQAAAPASLAPTLVALHQSGLNARDQAIQHRGYYEQLEVRAQPNAQVLDVVGRRADWQDLGSLGVIRDRADVVLRELEPSTRIVWNGHTFTTNQWGMRDTAYDKDKPADVLRIALVGPSHVMGNNVGDGETFEALVEARLNREQPWPRFKRYEILNFGVDGHSILQQVALLEDRVFAFSPDVVVATHYASNRSMTEGALMKIVDGRVPVPYDDVRTLLKRAGLDHVDQGRLPVPFAPARAAARWAGLDVRMPHGESTARIRSIADAVVDASFRRFATLAAAHRATPLVLGVDVVTDRETVTVPNARALQEAGLPVLDLFDVYPAERRPALRVAPWDDHPNAEGHRLVADRLYPALLERLDSRFASSH